MPEYAGGQDNGYHPTGNFDFPTFRSGVHVPSWQLGALEGQAQSKSHVAPQSSCDDRPGCVNDIMRYIPLHRPHGSTSATRGRLAAGSSSTQGTETRKLSVSPCRGPLHTCAWQTGRSSWPSKRPQSGTSSAGHGTSAHKSAGALPTTCCVGARSAQGVRR